MDVKAVDAKEILDNIKRKELVNKGEMTERDVDGLEVFEGELGKHYRWINAKTVNINNREIEGYRICTNLKVKAGIIENGAHKNGDLILAEISEDEYQKKLARIKEKGQRLEKTRADEFHELGARLRVKTDEDIERR